MRAAADHAAIERGRVLFHQKRYALAAGEFGRALGADPTNVFCRGMLALCLSFDGKHKDADAQATQAIGDAPDEGWCHAVLAAVRMRAGKATTAEVSARTAIEKDPDNTWPWHVLAELLLAMQRHAEALAAADAALALDPLDEDSHNLRAQALLALGRPAEAEAAARAALEIDPDSRTAHRMRAWALLRQGQVDRAHVHFLEALRIEPDSDDAQNGYVESIKSRSAFYRAILRLTLWFGRQNAAVGVGLVVALIFVWRGLQQIWPQAEWRISAAVFGVICAVFFLMFGGAGAVFNLMVRFDPVGKHALTPRQRALGNWCAVFLLACLLTGVAWLAGAPGLPLTSIALIGFALPPWASALAYERGAGRRRGVILAAATTAVGLASIGLLLLDDEALKRSPPPFAPFIAAFVMLCGYTAATDLAPPRED